MVDVLAPEGLGPHTDITTAGGKAFPAPGMTQALNRVELVPVSRGARTGWIPRPSLLGAIVAKSAAATNDHVDRERHLADLTFLCALIEKPMAQALHVTRARSSSLQGPGRTGFQGNHGKTDGVCFY